MNNSCNTKLPTPHQTFLANSSGMSLVEVLVGMGIVAIIGTATTSLITESYKNISNVASKVDENILVTDISSIFADKDLCKVAITAPGNQILPASGNFKPKIQLPGYGVINEGQTLQSKLVIKEFYMDSFTAPVPSGVAGQSKSAGTLWVRTEEVGATAKKSIVRKARSAGVFTLYFNNATRNVVGCWGTSAVPADEMCQQLGLVWNPATSKCGQSAQQSCADIGGTWNGTKCVISTISILGKSCSGGMMLTGYDGNGNPTCAAPPMAVAAAAPPPVVVYAPPTVTAAAPPTVVAVATPVPTPMATPRPAASVGLDLMTWSKGGSINTNIVNANPGDAVTYQRYVNGTLISAGTLGSVSSNGTYNMSAAASCDRFSAPCSTSFTVCAASTCKSTSGTIPD